jgi:protein SCO1/2
MLGLVVIGITVAYLREQPKAEKLPVLATVPDFSLTNQLGANVTLRTLQGHVWVADLIFTRCPGPCVKMTKHLGAVQARLPVGRDVRLISVTADPGFDTPEILKKYADKAGTDPAIWNFLTGPKQDVFHLAIEGLKFALVETEPGKRDYPEDLFVHSTLFMVIDRSGRIRATVEGAELDAPDKVLTAVNRLLAE